CGAEDSQTESGTGRGTGTGKRRAGAPEGRQSVARVVRPWNLKWVAPLEIGVTSRRRGRAGRRASRRGRGGSSARWSCPGGGPPPPAPPPATAGEIGR